MLLYLDENVDGRTMVKILRRTPVSFTTCRELGFRGTPDIDWIPHVTASGHIIITADQNLRYNRAEIETIRRHHARVVIIGVKNRVTIEHAANNLVNSLDSIARFNSRNDPPWLVRLSLPSGHDDALSRPGRLTVHRLGP